MSDITKGSDAMRYQVIAALVEGAREQEWNMDFLVECIEWIRDA